LGLVPGAILLGGCFGFALVLVVLYSFWQVIEYHVVPNWTLENYEYLFGVPGYMRTAFATVWMAGLATAIILVIAFPFSYWLTRYVSDRWRKPVLIAAVLPFFASYLLRIFAWISILGKNGVLNEALEGVGLTNKPLSVFLNDRPAVIIVLIYVYLPFGILSMYVALEHFNWELLRAARDLGATSLGAVWRVLLPAVRPGVITAVVITFIPMLGEYVTPLLVGGTKGVMFGNVIAIFFEGGEYARGAAASLLLALAIVLLLVIFRRPFASGVAEDVSS
jgi:spermidine/putrescine transport system permease protein